MSEPSNTDIIASTAASILSARENYKGILEEINLSREEEGAFDDELIVLVHNTSKMMGLILLTTLRVAGNEKSPEASEAKAALEKIRPLIDSLILLGEVTTIEDLEKIPFASQEEIDSLFNSNKALTAWLEEHGRALLEGVRSN
jgi:hypothetical protein